MFILLRPCWINDRDFGGRGFDGGEVPSSGVQFTSGLGGGTRERWVEKKRSAKRKKEVKRH